MHQTEALNTLNELAQAFGEDADFSSTVINSIATKAPLNSLTFTGTATFTGTVVGVSKAMVQLDKVDNTPGLDKPVSTATQIALDLKAPLTALDNKQDK